MGFGAKPATAAAPANVNVKADPEVISRLDVISKALFGVEAKIDLLTTKVDKLLAQPAPATPRPPTAAAPAPAHGASPPASAAPAATTAVSGSGNFSKEQLDGMNRKELSELAKTVGLDPTQKKAEELREMLLGKGGGAAKPASGAPAATGGAEPIEKRKARVLMKVIEDNYATFESQVSPESMEPDALRCGGDCMRCPNPEKHPSAADQIAACFQGVHDHLGITPPAV